ncbi:unnamed protein product [Polarella glacialis]|uniref:Trafficking protein particle complex subunit n=1 Tax=Polarella glacialis TaxID=89957 RepID=A0A813DEV1_POLGL|nr:unnamed protein product [Polarella glacialis]CAE8743418.1 unnamed protein product [Polarella glacialis]
MVVVQSLFIVNRNGSLIYDQEFQEGKSSLSSNDKMRLSSTFHGISAIAAQISPVKSVGGGSYSFLQPSGIVAIEADTFRMQCFHTPTGMKFFCVALPPYQDCEGLLRTIYGLYSDYALKNPFYKADMPIRCELFDKEILRLFSGEGAALALGSAGK